MPPKAFDLLCSRPLTFCVLLRTAYNLKWYPNGAFYTEAAFRRKKAPVNYVVGKIGSLKQTSWSKVTPGMAWMLASYSINGGSQPALSVSVKEVKTCFRLSRPSWKKTFHRFISFGHFYLFLYSFPPCRKKWGNYFLNVKNSWANLRPIAGIIVYAAKNGFLFFSFFPVKQWYFCFLRGKKENYGIMLPYI